MKKQKIVVVQVTPKTKMCSPKAQEKTVENFFESLEKVIKSSKRVTMQEIFIIVR